MRGAAVGRSRRRYVQELRGFPGEPSRSARAVREFELLAVVFGEVSDLISCGDVDLSLDFTPTHPPAGHRWDRRSGHSGRG